MIFLQCFKIDSIGSYKAGWVTLIFGLPPWKMLIYKVPNFKHEQNIYPIRIYDFCVLTYSSKKDRGDVS